MKTLICINEQVITDPNERAFYAANIAASSSILASKANKSELEKDRLSCWIPENTDLPNYPLCEVYGIDTMERFQTILNRAKDMNLSGHIYYARKERDGFDDVDNLAAIAITFVTDEEEWIIMK